MENFRQAVIVIDFLYTQHTYYTFKGKMYKSNNENTWNQFGDMKYTIKYSAIANNDVKIVYL